MSAKVKAETEQLAIEKAIYAVEEMSARLNLTLAELYSLRPDKEKPLPKDFPSLKDFQTGDL